MATATHLVPPDEADSAAPLEAVVVRFAGDTVFAWTDVLEKIDLGRLDAGALRLRLVGVKNSDPNTEEQPLKVTDDKGRERYHANVVLDLDYTVLIPRRS